MTKAIVLAGSSNEGSLKGYSSETSEALIKIGDKCMVEYVVEALMTATTVEKIIVVGPKERLAKVLTKSYDIQIAQGGTKIIDSLLNGLELLNSGEDEKILVVTSDIPLITGPIIDNFICRASKEEADVVYPLVAKSLNQAKFPGVKRTYVKLKEGIFTGGNLFLINPQIIKPCAKYAQELVSYRKSPLKLLNYIGLAYLFKYLTRELSLLDVQNRVGELFNIKGKAIIVNDPEIGVDIDKPSDLELVRGILEKDLA